MLGAVILGEIEAVAGVERKKMLAAREIRRAAAVTSKMNLSIMMVAS